MKTLIQSAKIIDKNSPFNGKVVDVLIHNGRIAEIGKVSTKAERTIAAKGMILSVGWFDLRANFGDPGLEHKEDLFSGLAAATAGGFTGVALLPNTAPAIQNKNDIKYLLSRSNENITSVHPIAAVTIDTKGEDFTEMIDLHEAGAVAFSDGLEPIWQSDILVKSLQYLQKFDGLLINKPEDKRLNLFGQMNEGISSTTLGMKGMPKLAEELIVDRDIALLEYAGGKLHLSNISTAGSIAKIKAAKKKGLQITCDVASFQGLFDDDVLEDFDTNYKVNPPFRSKDDAKAIVKGLTDGTIDAIVSSHQPHDEESKKLEFDLADFGIISLQTVAANIAELSDKVDVEVLIDKLTSGPRSILQFDLPVVDKGKEANLTLFDPKSKWEFNTKTNKSRAVNSPYYGETLQGQVMAVFNNGKEWILS